MATEHEKVFQTVLAEHSGNYRLALLDLAYRYVHLSQFVSPGFARWGMNDTGADIQLDPPPVDDGAWVETGREA